MDKPSVGRIVHYVSYGTPNGEYKSVCRAAIITEVPDDSMAVSLMVANPTGLFFKDGIMHDSTENQAGTWHWPERTGGIVTQAVVLSTDGIEHIIPLKGR